MEDSPAYAGDDGRDAPDGSHPLSMTGIRVLGTGQEVPFHDGTGAPAAWDRSRVIVVPMTTHTNASDQLSTDLPVASSRPPATAIVATVLTILLASVGTYGALYFSGLDGYDPVDATFLSMYCYLSAIGIVSVIVQLRGSAIGRAGVIAWAIFMALFTLVKLITIGETEAISFGVIALIVVALEFSRPTRRFIRSRQA